MTETNDAPRDCYLLPSIDMTDARLKMAGQNGLWLDAFIELKQQTIPAIAIEADEAACLVMSRVENCARRPHRPIDLMREMGTFCERGDNDRQIADRLGDVCMIAGLLERSEERLVTAVEAGLLPLDLAIEVSKTDAEGAQCALMDACPQEKPRGGRNSPGSGVSSNNARHVGRRCTRTRDCRAGHERRSLASEALVRACQKEADRNTAP